MQASESYTDLPVQPRTPYRTIVGNNPVNWVDPYGLRMICACQGRAGSSECWKTFRCWWKDDPPPPDWLDDVLCTVISYFACPVVGVETGGTLGTVCSLISTYLFCPDSPDPDEPYYPPDDDGMCMIDNNGK